MLPTVAAVFLVLYCLGRPTCWSYCLLTHFTIVVVGWSVRFPTNVLMDTTGSVPSWCPLQQQQHLECQHVKGGYFANIINNNVNTSSINTIANTTSNINIIASTSSFPSLHHPQVRVVEGLRWMLVFDVLLLLLMTFDMMLMLLMMTSL